MLGVPGLMEVYRAGRVALANAPGTGIADDKVVYAYVPQIIKYYLGEDADPAERADVRLLGRNAAQLRAGEPRQAGREAGERIGRLRHADRPAARREEQRASSPTQIKANPRNYIAQPTLGLSRVPVLVDDGFEGRHVDLRPFILYGQDIFVLPGGLTRVALQEGLAGRQLVARRRQQGHLGARRRSARRAPIGRTSTR